MSDEFDDDIQEVPSHSPDFRTDLAEELARLAPEAVADGKIDVEKLRELLDADSADDGRERFGLMWPGKSRALKAAQAPTTATLLPDRETSKDWDTTHNVFIEGDNLEVLKILQKHYHGKIKMIYIDPPYNTGNDFIYPDNYKEGLQTYLEWTSQVSEDGKKLSSNPESAGRYHSNWLNMMYPRLKLARNLLTDDGVIFISIGESELSNLQMICDAVFLETNRIGVFKWNKTAKAPSLSRTIRSKFEYVLCYGRDDLRALRGKASYNQMAPLFNSGNNPRIIEFPAGSVDFLWANREEKVVIEPFLVSDYVELIDSIVVNESTNLDSFRLRARFSWTQETLLKRFEDGQRFAFKKSDLKTMYYTMPHSPEERFIAPSDLISPEECGVGRYADAKKDLQHLFGGLEPMGYTKPVSLVSHLCRMALGSSFTVLDFFAGSGTTAHAVMKLNAEDGGSRRHIQVQLPEPVDPESEAGKAGFGTIADIARERIRRAGEKIKEELAEQLSTRETPLDVGFRSYKLSDTSFVKWKETSNTERNALEERLAGLRGSADDDATPEMLLTELLLKQGYSLTENVSEIEIAGLNVWSVADGALLAIMDEHIKPSLDQLRAVVESGPVRLVVLEDVFAGDDQLKTNLVQHAKTHAVELWTS